MGRRLTERYRSGFEAFFQLLVDLGFSTVSICYPMDIVAGPFGAASSFLTNYRQWELPILYKALDEAIVIYRPQVRIVSPRSSLFLLRSLPSNGVSIRPCSGGHDFFFMSALDGLVYPCGYLNRPLGRFHDIDFDVLRKANRTCKLCHWECCFDPDQTLGRLNFVREPASVLKYLLRNDEFSSLLREDIRYFFACDFFRGRKPANTAHLKRASSRRRY